MKIFLLLIFVAVHLLSVNAQELSDVIEKVSPAIFKITTYDASGNELAIGTEFFINANGAALTNYHVLLGAYKAKIKTNDDKTYLIDNILSWSKESDMVKFAIKNELNETFTFLKLSSATPKAGERIFIIGSPMGLDKSVSDGIVSSVRQDEIYGETIQVTAPISQGNSGSPLMNMQGEALGVVTYYLQTGQNLNFAVSVKNMNIMESVNALKFPTSEYPTLSKSNTTSSFSNEVSSNTNDPTDVLYYSGSSLNFCTMLNVNQQPDNPDETFFIDKQGGWVYMFVSNDKKLETTELIIDVFKKKGDDYSEFVETKRFNVDPCWYDTHFKYNFYNSGDYKIFVYTIDEAWINTGYITIKYEK